MPLRIDWLKIIPLEGVWLEHQELFCFHDLLWLNQSRDTKQNYLTCVIDPGMDCLLTASTIEMASRDDSKRMPSLKVEISFGKTTDLFDHGIVLDDSKQMAILPECSGLTWNANSNLCYVNDEKPTQVCLLPEFWSILFGNFNSTEQSKQEAWFTQSTV